MKEELRGDSETPMRKQLRETIAALSQSRLPRATDALAMIWNGMMGPLDLRTPEPKPVLFVKPTFSLNWHRVKLALLKSIPTGTFIDVQFFVYSAIDNDLPVVPRPLYASRIVIERWGAAIATRKLKSLSKFTRPRTVTAETAGMDSQPPCLLDGLTDDYEYLHGELAEVCRRDKTGLCVSDLQNFRQN